MSTDSLIPLLWPLVLLFSDNMLRGDAAVTRRSGTSFSRFLAAGEETESCLDKKLLAAALFSLPTLYNGILLDVGLRYRY